MATFKAYLSGGSYGIGNPSPTGGKRGEITGWSAAAVRRHTRWLYSVDVSELDGCGEAVTLTLRNTPQTSDEWARLVKNLKERLRRMGLVRWHWVVEWQRRGAPHLHLAVYSTADNAHRVSVVVARNGAAASRVAGAPTAPLLGCWGERRRRAAGLGSDRRFRSGSACCRWLV